MCERLDDFAGAEISVVFFDSTERLPEYRAHHGVPDAVRLLADPDRQAYQAFGLGRGSWWNVWGPRTVAAYVRLLAKGRRISRHQGDSLQLGGDFVIDHEGTVVFAFRPDGPDDRPAVDLLVGALPD